MLSLPLGRPSRASSSPLPLDVWIAVTDPDDAGRVSIEVVDDDEATRESGAGEGDRT
jgi:hypothetical protein